MQQFIGTKLVESEAMNRLDYNKYRGWELPEDENGDDEGYLVEYLDGGESNHPNHKGYISWSPKEQFDNAYKPFPTTDEKEVLEKQYSILGYFKYEHLPPHLQEISKPFHDLAYQMPKAGRSAPEVAAGLRKLLEAKDCAVRSAV